MIFFTDIIAGKNVIAAAIAQEIGTEIHMPLIPNLFDNRAIAQISISGMQRLTADTESFFPADKKYEPATTVNGAKNNDGDRINSAFSPD